MKLAPPLAPIEGTRAVSVPADRTMNEHQMHEYLVRLAKEAVHAAGYSGFEEKLDAALRERMAQAAQVFEIESTRDRHPRDLVDAVHRVADFASRIAAALDARAKRSTPKRRRRAR